MQSIIIPEKCPYCSSSRRGIQEGKAYFGCGAVALRGKEGLRWKRPVDCVLGERAAQGSEQKIQAGQGDSNAVR